MGELWEFYCGACNGELILLLLSTDFDWQLCKEVDAEDVLVPGQAG